MNMKLWTALDWICRKSLEKKLPFFPGKGDENMKKKKKKSRKMNPLRRYIQPLYNYQFSSKLDSSILVTALLSLATPTEDTNPLEFWLLHFLVSLHLSLSLSLSLLCRLCKYPVLQCPTPWHMRLPHASLYIKVAQAYISTSNST